MRIDAQEQFSASNSYRQAFGGARRVKVEAPITGFAESRTTLTPAAPHVFATRERKHLDSTKKCLTAS